ncbi:MAG: NifB/NifX family molybdenum-iron cluster-binding protein [Thermodesulfovibrionales bacterium]|nr:NifB/NifX family molybdenum-iron cluster-binding protein [Pseudomonadota bacterium]MCG2721869.1 NifB/NifX family molybdenum-iron cluster-binding protein [Thermodesulfovibrionales bacterium]
MKVCFPVAEVNGVASEVYGHFGSAPAFVIVETNDNKVTTINNDDQHHAQGACNPLKKFNNHQVDALVAAGIGMGALNVLNQSGIKVFQAQAPTVRENIALLKAGNLPEFTSQHTCAGHGHGGGCGH